MNLTVQQQQSVKAYILADPVLGPKSSGPGTDYGFISDALNAAASPAFTVWRTSVAAETIMLNGFDWARVDNLSVGKARIWEWMFQFGSINPSKSNIRAGIDATWVGTAADLAVRAAVYAHCKRLASVLEKIFAQGVGSDASPAVPAVEEQIGVSQIGEIMAS